MAPAVDCCFIDLIDRSVEAGDVATYAGRSKGLAGSNRVSPLSQDCRAEFPLGIAGIFR
ncbi:hypothetical protein [Mesorhizobium silamurunense]|uniref:hypothetical protein n=1 Tax=Mesorhizobium silamurunense TaxID=499528 RepID=UPI001784FE1E|nr:hypothetical protein [Mesorhizobium silamurunense]